MTQPTGENKAESIEDIPLLKGNWFPEHLVTIKKLPELKESGPTKQQAAVFDFDNTCIFRDIGQAVFRFQAFELCYKISPDSLASILPEPVGTLGERPLKQVISTLIQLYSALWENLASENFNKAKQQTEAPLFTTLLLWFVDKARKDKHFGPRFVLPFLAKLFAGFTTDEVKGLARETISVVRNEQLITREIKQQFPDPIGLVKTSFEMGMRPYPEMRTLQNWLNSNSIQCNVISASTDWLVQVAAEVFDFPLSNENIFGIRVEVDENGKLTTRELDNYPVTFREGKVAIIDKFIQGPPVFVAGDADTDYEMLTLPGIAVRLIINRNQQGQIKSLYTNPDYLLQGINFSKGKFIPSKDSISS